MEEAEVSFEDEAEAAPYHMLRLADGYQALGTSARRSITISERKVLLALIDACLLILVTGLLHAFGIGPRTYPAAGFALAGLWLTVGYFTGLYDVTTTLASRRAGMLAVAQTAFVVTGALLVAFFVYPTHHRESVPALALSSLAIIAVVRLAFYRLADASLFQRRILVIGTGTPAQALIEMIQRRRGHGVTVVGVLDDDLKKVGSNIMNVPVLGGFSAVWPVVVDEAVEEVVLCTRNTTSESLLEGLGICYEHGVPVTLMPHLYEEVSGQVPVEHLGRDWVAAFPLRRSGGSLYRVVKRLLDVLVSGIAILAALPFMGVAAVLVRISSDGPVFFRQPRAGLHGHPFEVIKFRTMYQDAGQLGTKIGDMADRSRVTPIGKWLRRTYLDELPQLFLVLRGHMSLVGPRPKRADQARDLERTIPLWRAKYSVQPGLTGWGQLQYGYAKSSTEEMARLRYDLYYIKHCSLWLDFFILVKTAARLMRLKGF